MADKPEICGFCHSDKGRETIYVGKIEYGTKCLTCGATQQVHTARDEAAGSRGYPGRI
jgi:hypothetical protein